MPGPRVRSETGALRRVLVHRPCGELSNVAPDNYRDFLLNDILYERHAQEEHDAFVSLLRDAFGVEVLYFEDLLTRALMHAGSLDRALLADTVARVEGLGARARERVLRLVDVSSEDEARRSACLLVAGLPVSVPDSGVGEYLEGRRYHLPPLPNTMLVRDVAAVVGDEMYLAWNSMRARRRENLLWRFALRHSCLPGTSWTDWMDGVPRDDPGEACALEGGNVLQVAPDVIAVGKSLRTDSAAVDRLIESLSRRATRAQHVVVAILPGPYEHLDTVFTMLCDDEALVFPPSVFGNGPESLEVLAVTVEPGREPAWRRAGNLLDALGEVLGRAIRVVPCGGEDPIAQRREQWWGGASALAVAPGRVVLFRSAQRTLGELARAGYACVEVRDVLAGRCDPGRYEKCAISIRGTELSRARAGPRSLVLPLVRD